MQSKFKRILFGGDYNPNQWPKDVWAQDMAYFKDAHINSATINVFSWAKIQPSENEYNFTELDEIVDMLSNENYDIVIKSFVKRHQNELKHLRMLTFMAVLFSLPPGWHEYDDPLVLNAKLFFHSLL